MNYQKLTEDWEDLDLQGLNCFLYCLDFLKKTSHVKIITCQHSMQNFYQINKERIVNLHQNFKCGCHNTYESHQLYFCICPSCYNDLALRKECDCKMINEKWMKFCVQRPT